MTIEELKKHNEFFMEKISGLTFEFIKGTEKKQEGLQTSGILKKIQDVANEYFSGKIEIIPDQIFGVILEEFENLKCCGNCKYSNPPMVARPANCKKYEPGSCCSSWEFDGKERIIREKRGH